MESDKSLKKINNRTLLEIIIEKSMKQLDYILLILTILRIIISRVRKLMWLKIVLKVT